MSQQDRQASLDLYIKEITKVDLLTADEEIALANRIERGDTKARDLMIKANLRLVVAIAREYANYGIPMQDLISEGNIGLMKAVERFDPEKGGKLSTYAAYWIKQMMRRALNNQSRTIRVPVHMVDRIAKMKKISTMLAEQFDREPTEQELSDELGIPRSKLALIKQYSQSTKSLDAPVFEGETTEYGDTLSDEKAINPAEALSSKNMHLQVGSLLQSLSERELKIIDARFGLNGQTPKTLEEVGSDFGLTRERIRQLQNLAISKMRTALKKIDKPLPKLFRSQS